MEGYKTLIAAGLIAVLNTAVAFGIEISEEQRASILGLLNAVVVPIVMAVLRLVTKGPTPAAKILGD